MKIVNIMATGIMENPFDLDEILKIDNTEKASVWVKTRLQPENYYVAFYSSGKFLITGVKDIKTINSVASRVVKLLEDNNINNKFKEVQIKNMVATDKTTLDIPLQDIILKLNTKKSSYEPEQFPGLFYKDDDGLSYTLFSSGKIIITGFTDLELAKNNLKEFKQLLKN